MIVTKYTNGGGGGGTSDYSQLTNKPRINGVELTTGTTTFEFKDSYVAVDNEPNYSQGYAGQTIVLPEGEAVITGQKSGYTINIHAEQHLDDQIHDLDLGTITSSRNSTIRTISFQLKYRYSPTLFEMRFKKDGDESWTLLSSVSADTVEWRNIYTETNYRSWVRLKSSAASDFWQSGSFSFDFVPQTTSNWDYQKYADWTLPSGDTFTTGTQRTRWRDTSFMRKSTNGIDWYTVYNEPVTYCLFVTSGGTVTAGTINALDKLNGLKDIFTQTLFYYQMGKNRFYLAVTGNDPDINPILSYGDLIINESSGGWNSPILEGYVNLIVDGEIVKYHGKWQKEYNSWTTLVWEPYSPVQSSGVANIWKGTQAEYDVITAKSDSTLYVIVPAATGQPANEIWYTTDTGTTPLSQALQVAVSGFNPSLGNSIVSDTIVDGVGKMVFTNPVTAIPDHAFFDGISGVLYEGYGDYTITLPEGVTSIGEAAFDEINISGISLPSTLIEIGQWAFYGAYTADGSITFKGTATQWNDDITFGENWMGGETNLCEIKCPDSTTIDYCS